MVECANSVKVGEIDIPLDEPIEIPVVVEKEKKKRAKKVSKTDEPKTGDDVVPVIVEEAGADVVPVIDKVEKKKRVKKEKDVSIIVGEVEVPLVQEEKKKRVKKEKVEAGQVVEKKKRVKKEKVSNVEVTQELKEEVKPETELEEEELVLHSVSVDDVEYYYDADNRLYDTNHSVIGTFDPESLTISIQ